MIQNSAELERWDSSCKRRKWQFPCTNIARNSRL